MRVRDERVRAAIVEAVVAMVDEQGWDGITVRRIGQRMHYAASTIVYHVGSFDELTESVRRSVARQVTDALFRDLGTGPDRFLPAADRLLEWSRQHPNLHRFYADHLPRPDPTRVLTEPVPEHFLPDQPGAPRPRTLVYFDRALQCAMEGALLLDDHPERQREFLAAELEHLSGQWRRLVLTS